jgi:hypothetical protein
LPESVEHFAGVRLDEGVGVGLVRGDVHVRRVEVVEVDRPDDVFGNAGGQGDGDAVAFPVFGVPGALAAQVMECARSPQGWSRNFSHWPRK